MKVIDNQWTRTFAEEIFSTELVSKIWDDVTKSREAFDKLKLALLIADKAGKEIRKRGYSL